MITINKLKYNYIKKYGDIYDEIYRQFLYGKFHAYTAFNNSSFRKKLHHYNEFLEEIGFTEFIKHKFYQFLHNEGIKEAFESNFDINYYNSLYSDSLSSVEDYFKKVPYGDYINLAFRWSSASVCIDWSYMEDMWYEYLNDAINSILIS